MSESTEAIRSVAWNLNGHVLSAKILEPTLMYGRSQIGHADSDSNVMISTPIYFADKHVPRFGSELRCRDAYVFLFAKLLSSEKLMDLCRQ